MEACQLRELVLTDDGGAAARAERAATLDLLVGCLQDGPPADRVRAAEQLAAFGLEAVLPLCEALNSTDDDLRIAAARSLGTIGDARAVVPLIAALRSRCTGGSGLKHRQGGRVLLGTMLAMVLIPPILAALITGKPSGIFFAGVAGPLVAWATQRRPRGRVFEAISEALIQITAKDPTPAVREVLPELDVLATDSLQQDRQTRAALREAARRIEALTENLRSLPIAAEAPEPEVATLPTPAHPRVSDAEVLPRVTS